MRCMEQLNQIESIILHYLQGGVSEEEMRRLEVWLGESDDNKSLLFELKTIYGMRPGGSYPDREEIKLSMKRLSAKMDAVRPDKHPSAKMDAARPDKHLTIKPPNRMIGFFKYAAVAVIFILLTLSVQMLLHKDKPVTYIELDVESGPRMSRLTLPDGTQVVLNASTKFQYPDQFDGKIREVFLDGEAFFDVTHNAKIPFVVHTDRQKISVLGTVFNVMDYSTDDYAITTLVSGSVRIQPVSGTEEQGKSYLLKPNQQVFFDKSTSEIAISNVKIDMSRTWVNKIYHFHDETLFTIMQRLEKIYGVSIIIADEALKKEKYTGTFPTDKEIDEIMKIINFEKQFSYTIVDETITISTNPLKKKKP